MKQKNGTSRTLGVGDGAVEKEIQKGRRPRRLGREKCKKRTVNEGVIGKKGCDKRYVKARGCKHRGNEMKEVSPSPCLTAATFYLRFADRSEFCAALHCTSTHTQHHPNNSMSHVLSRVTGWCGGFSKNSEINIRDEERMEAFWKMDVHGRARAHGQ